MDQPAWAVGYHATSLGGPVRILMMLRFEADEFARLSTIPLLVAREPKGGWSVSPKEPT